MTIQRIPGGGLRITALEIRNLWGVKEAVIRPGQRNISGARVDMPGIAETEGDAETTREDAKAGGALRPFQIDSLARKVAAKAFVADLLREWKASYGSDHETASERGVGG